MYKKTGYKSGIFRVCVAGILLCLSSYVCFPTIIQGAESGTDTEEEDSYESLDSLFVLTQPYLKKISAYRPIYFLVGANPEKSKFQFSFKYAFFNEDDSLAEDYPWVKGFYFAYTQTSFWDLDSSSRPFEDSSYKPEFFFITSNLSASDKKIPRVFFKTGIQHESNGRGGEYSRGTNFYYIKPIFISFDTKNLIGLEIAPVLWAYVENDDTNNPDIDDYRGYFELEMKCGKADRLILETRFRPAKEGNSIQVDLSYPLDKLLCDNCDLYFHIQYANSLAENLLNYRDRVESFRVGFSIVR